LRDDAQRLTVDFWHGRFITEPREAPMVTEARLRGCGPVSDVSQKSFSTGRACPAEVEAR
jgi:hypothetical protein